MSKSDPDLWQKSHAAPGLLLPGSVEKKTPDGQLRRASSVSILGLRASDWMLLDGAEVAAPKDSGIVLGFRTATELNAAVGDSVSVWVELPSSIPRDSLLGERENISLEMVLTVDGRVAGIRRGIQILAAARSATSIQRLCFPVDVSAAIESGSRGRPRRRNPVARPARINTILAGSDQRPAESEVRFRCGPGHTA